MMRRGLAVIEKGRKNKRYYVKDNEKFLTASSAN